MLKNMKIGIISDLHIGAGARAKDLSPYDKHDSLDDNYLRTFLDFLNDEPVSVDYLIITGDVSDRAQPEEFELASTVIQKIMEKLSVPVEHVIFVPGNHDCNWELLKSPDPTGFRKSHKYDALKHDKWIFENILSCATDNLCEFPFFSVWESPDAVIIGYNSSWHDDPDSSPHYGKISIEIIQKLEIKLKSLDLNENKLKIFVTHHHPLNYKNPVQGKPDFSAMDEAESLIKLLNKFNFDIFLHGHKHSPKLQTNIIGSDFPLAIVCAGSFSHKLEREWSGHVNNQFHILDIVGRSAKYKTAYGALISYTYLCGHGWMQSKECNGIRHKEYFGSYINEFILEEHLLTVINVLITGSNCIKSSELLHEEYLQYLPRELVLKVLTRIASRDGYILHETTGDEILLVREG